MEQLKRIYEQGKLAPFLGAGVSIPFKNPSWSDLIKNAARSETDLRLYETELDLLLNNKQYFEAIRLVQKNMNVDDPEYSIQKSVCIQLLNNHYDWQRKDFNCDNNILDLLKLKCNNIFTFNYDKFFEGVFESKNQYVHTKILEKESINTQKIDDEDRDPILWHVHGDMLHSTSIIFTEDNYERLYSSEQFQKKMEFVINHFTFLFIGVSFDDPFIKQFFEYNKNFFLDNTHYIMYDKGKSIDKEELKKRYGLEVITYEKDNDHVLGIREKLNQILSGEKSEVEEEISHSASTVINNSGGFNPVQLRGKQKNVYIGKPL